jgi:tRNA A-37 threonylcarbamoyl transferase component Bud32
MTTSSQSDFENLPLELAKQVEQQCQRFEADWRANEQPCFEDFVPGVPEAGRQALVRELVLLDVFYRRQAGEQVRAEDYQWFPDLDPEWLNRVVSGLTPDQAPRAGAKGDGSMTLGPSPVKAPETGSDLNPDQEVSPPAPASEETISSAVWPQVPGYEIQGKLGQGGMGIVYKARHIKLNRLVALKLIQAHAWSDEYGHARFRTEAEAIARLQHSNIVQIFEIGEQDSRPFLALEYAEGGSLDQQLNGTPLPPADAAGLVETLARAVHAAHQRGIVHRDLKPANVLRTANGTLKLTDFGLAKKLDASAVQTQSGAIVGTPSYMAPEQAAGKNREIGPATDVYALGAILYELLTGRPPFKAATPLDTVLQVLQDDPVSPRYLQPKTPRDLETICLKCLEKQPGRRYARADELADDLKRWTIGKPVRARRTSAISRTVKWARRSPARAGLVLLGGIVVVLIGVGVAMQLRTANREKEKHRFALYVNKVITAHASWGGLGAKQALDECPKDLRQWEWRFVKRLGDSPPPRFLDSVYPEFRFFYKELEDLVNFAFTPDSAPLALLRDDSRKRVHLCNATFDDQHRRLAEGSEDIVRAIMSTDCQRLAVVRAGPAIESSRKPLFRGPHQVGWMYDSFAPPTVEIWDASSDHQLCTLSGLKSDGVGSIAFSRDGQRLAVAAVGVEAGIWDASTGQQLHTLEALGVQSLAFSPDGRRLASAGQDGTVKVWDSMTGKVVRSLKGHTDWVNSVTFSPDAQRLASASRDRTVRIWDAIDGDELYTLIGHAESVESVAFSPDGQRLASGSVRSVRVWDTTLGVETITLRVEQREQRQSYCTGHVTFSPNGHLLACAGQYALRNGGFIWDATP